MRVLLVEHKEIWGGGQVALVNVLREWQRTGAPIEPFIVCPPHAALAPRVRALGVPGATFEPGRIEKTKSSAWNFAQRITPTIHLLNVIRRERAKVIVANGAFSFLAAVFAAKTARLPILWIEHNTTLPNDALVRRMLHWADDIVVVSAAIRTQFVNLAPDVQNKIRLIYNGVDAELFCEDQEAGWRAKREFGWDRTQHVVGTVSRLSPEKGIEYFVDAVPEIARRVPEARFLIVGDGPQRAELETRAGSAAIRFAGFREDIPELLNIMHIFVMPSLAEAFGLAAVEALATGCPVVASNVGGLSEIVTPETGILVPPCDAHALAEAIISLLQNSERHRTMGEHGRARILENFTLARQATQLQNVLVQMAKQ